MRCSTATDFIRKRRAYLKHPAPMEGSKLRAVYDLFQANKGIPIDQSPYFVGDNCTVTKLTDFYGLDLRCVQRGNRRTGRPSKWVLAGEWFGRVYVDYIAERLSEAS